MDEISKKRKDKMIKLMAKEYAYDWAGEYRIKTEQQALKELEG